MAAGGVAAWRIPAAAARTVSSRSFASAISSVTSSTPAPGTLRIPRQAASTAPGSSGSSTTSSSMAPPASRSSTSSPTTLPCTAPISAATAPNTPGASGSQIRILVNTLSPPAFRVSPSPPRLVDSRHADSHPHGVLGVAGVDALHRWHVAVVTPASDRHVAFPDRAVVGRVVGPPTTRPHLHPGMALPGDLLADGGVRVRVEVARDVAGRQARLLGEGQRQGGE